MCINSNDSRNNVILLNNGTVIECLNFIETEDKVLYVIGKPFNIIDNFYSNPLKSSTFNIRVVECKNENFQAFLCTMIFAKLCKLPYGDNFVVFPIIHTCNTFHCKDSE